MSRLSAPASERGTSIFVTDRDVVEGTGAHVAAVHHALLAAARRIATPWEPLRYLRTIYLPSQQRCLSFFDAVDAELIRTINDTAQFPDVEIWEAVEYSTHRLGKGGKP